MSKLILSLLFILILCGDVFGITLSGADLYLGDGSDGAYAPSSGSGTFAIPVSEGDFAVKNYTDVTLLVGTSLTTNNRSKGLIIFNKGTFTMESGSAITMTGRGYPACDYDYPAYFDSLKIKHYPSLRSQHGASAGSGGCNGCTQQTPAISSISTYGSGSFGAGGSSGSSGGDTAGSDGICAGAGSPGSGATSGDNGGDAQGLPAGSITIYTYYLDLQEGSVFESTGTSTGANGASGTAGGGGGGGNGGGLINVFFHEFVSGVTKVFSTVDVTGTNGGSPGSTTLTPAPTAGSKGSDGVFNFIQIKR